MDPEDNDYELERQKTIAENRALLDSLGFEEGGTAKLNLPKPAKPVKPKPAAGKKRKSEVSSVADDGPRRRSGRIAGLEADGEALKIKLEEEEKEREVIRIINRKEREQVMELGKMVEDSNDAERADLNTYLNSIASCSNPRRYPPADSDEDPYTTKGQAAEVARLKEAFKNMSLKANAKVTPERAYCMVVHSEKTKTLVFSGDKYGMLGIWDALGTSEEQINDEDDTADVKEAEVEEGRVWHVQAHARNSITCMKVDPINGSSLFTSSYDCSLRNLSFESCISTELFAFNDEDMLITHFDLDPSGQQAWISDKNGGISHCDFREGKTSRRRWVVQEEGRAAKLGGISVNPRTPHLLVTAGNDQHLRIWDTRCLLDMPSRGSEHWSAPTVATAHVNGNGDADVKPQPRLNNAPTENFPSDKVAHYMETKAGKGLLRASYQHGKSCSAAYWDPWGKRVLTTSYDDKLRVWTLPEGSFATDGPLASTHFQPTKTIPHNCQTGRWLTILRAQWSLNMDYIPHFTIGNMKRTLDVVASTGDKICSLWTDGVSAVPAVTASHPGRVDHVLGANTSGRVQLWTSDA